MFMIMEIKKEKYQKFVSKYTKGRPHATKNVFFRALPEGEAPARIFWPFVYHVLLFIQNP